MPALIEALGDSYQPVRENAARALGIMRESALASVPFLINALRDEDVEVRTNVAISLALL